MSTPNESREERSSNVEYVPFGVSELDSNHVGIPTGSSVMLAGAPDAGSSAFTYTSLARLMLAKHEPEHVPDTLSGRHEHIPESVTYLTLMHDREHIYSELEAVLDDVQFDVLTEHLTVTDYAQRYLDMLPVPAALFDERRSTDEVVAPDPSGEPAATPDEATFRELLDDVSSRLAEARDDIVVLDSFADLRRAQSFGLESGRATAFLAGLREAASNWGNLVYLLYERRAGQVRSEAAVQGLCHGYLYFYSNDKGFKTYRTMRVGSFGGALDSEQQITFDSRIGDDGFRAKATKKISPSRF
jgi:archaellum biogenesis ATPase FlaH